MSINFLNRNRSFEVSSTITEWDIRRAGLNIIKEFSLLPESTITELEGLPKKEADIKIGKMQIKNKEFAKVFDQKFTDVMEEFMSNNNIDMDYDVTSIKKDACFVINKKISNDTIGKYIKFIPKHEYHAYVYLKPYEMYFKRNGEIDIKGLTSVPEVRNKIIELHKNGILNFVEATIELAESTQMNMKQLNSFLHEFVVMYKNRELDFDYYREFNVESRFRYQLLGSEIMADNIDSDMLNHVNIEFNYKNIILPLINYIC